MPEHLDSTSSIAQSAKSRTFSGEACDVLGATVRDFLSGRGAAEQLAVATARLCREAHTRGLTANETLAEIRSTLSRILEDCPLTSSDRSALVALAIDECVHAFYHEQR
jgi:hypothetical protein